MSTLITITYNSNDTLKYTSEDLKNKKKVKLSNIRSINVYSHNLNLNEINDDADKTDIILPKVIIEIQEDNTEIKLFQNTAIKEIDTITINNPKYYKVNLQNLFAGAKKLVSIRIFQVSNTVNCSGMFKDCKSLKTIPLLNTITVTDMSYMFYGSSVAKIPNIDTSKVTNMSYMFANCTELENSPYLNTYNTTNLSHIFEGCTKLKSIPNMNTSKVEDMSYMVASCTNLKSFPRLDVSKVRNLAYMFKDCTSLDKKTTLNISEGADTTGMFDGCSSMIEEDISTSNKTSNVFVNSSSGTNNNAYETNVTTEDSTISAETTKYEERIEDTTTDISTDTTTSDSKNYVLTNEDEEENALSNSPIADSIFNETSLDENTSNDSALLGESSILDNSVSSDESTTLNNSAFSDKTDNILIENKYELALLKLVRTLVDGNHARASQVTVETHCTTEAKLSHLSQWRFYAATSKVNIRAGCNAPVGSVIVSLKNFTSEKDRYIQLFSNSANMLETAFNNLNVSYQKGKEISDIGTNRNKAVTTSVCLACFKICPSCDGFRKVRCYSCDGAGTKTCYLCGGRGESFSNSRYHRCSKCGGRGKVRCYTCIGTGRVKCGKCDGTEEVTQYITITGYADSIGKCSVLGDTPEDKLLNQYISGNGNFEKFVKFTDFTFVKKSFPKNDTAILEYSGTIETADLTFSIESLGKEYRVLSFGTPAELFMTCNLYDDLFSKEIRDIESQSEGATNSRYYKNEFAKLEKYSLFKNAFAYLAAHKQHRNDPSVGTYMFNLCSGCISEKSASVLGFHSSRILNSISATRNLFLTVISYCAVFIVFAVDDEHFFELNYTGKFFDILSRYFIVLLKALLIYFVVMFINKIILDLRNICVKKEYRQACREYYLEAYMIMLHVCVAISFTYGIFAHKGDVPAIGDTPYALKKEYVDPYITEPSKNAWNISLDWGNSYVIIPIKNCINELNEKSKSKSVKDSRGNQNSK